MSITRYNYTTGSISSNDDVNIDGDLYVQGNIVSDGNVIWPEPIEITKFQVPEIRTNDYLFPIATWNASGNEYNMNWGIIFANMIGGGLTGEVIVRSINGFGRWTDSISLLNLNIRGNLQFNDVGGSVGNVLVKNSSNQPVWSTITVSSISPGTANTVLTTNAAGNAVAWSNNLTLATLNLTGNLQFAGTSGSSGQFLKKTSASTQQWTRINAQDITNGTANQVLVTNNAGNSTTWTSNITVETVNTNSITFSASPSALNFYSYQIVPMQWGRSGVYFGNIVNVHLVRTGKQVTIQIDRMNITTVPTNGEIFLYNTTTTPNPLRRIPSDFTPVIYAVLPARIIVNSVKENTTFSVGVGSGDTTLQRHINIDDTLVIETINGSWIAQG